MPTQTSIPIPPRLLIRCRRSERGNLEANVATTIRQKIAAHYITASTEFSNPASLMRNSSFLILVWLPLIWNRVFLIWGALSPMRNSPFLIRVRPLLIWDSPFLIWGALSPMRSSPFLIRVELSLIWNGQFLIWGGFPPMRNTPFLIGVWLSLIWNSPLLIWDGLPPMRNTPFLIRVCLPLIWNHQFLIWGGFPPMRNTPFLIGVWLSPMRKSRFLIWGKASLFREAGYPANSGNRKPDGFGRRVRRDGTPQLRKSRASNSVKAAVPVWQVRGGISHPASGTGQTDVPLQDARRSLRGS